MKTFLKTTVFIITCLIIPIAFGDALYNGLLSEAQDQFASCIFSSVAGFLMFLLFTTLFVNLTSKK